jgi:hypothetical protein
MGVLPQPHAISMGATQWQLQLQPQTACLPGICVLMHQKPDNHSTWLPHAENGWYIGPALESYRCYRIWMFTMRAERASDTISWFPTKVNMPLTSSNDLILTALPDIAHALQHPSPMASLVPLNDNHVTALHKLMTTF